MTSFSFYYNELYIQAKHRQSLHKYPWSFKIRAQKDPALVLNVCYLLRAFPFQFISSENKKMFYDTTFGKNYISLLLENPFCLCVYECDHIWSLNIEKFNSSKKNEADNIMKYIWRYQENINFDWIEWWK